MHSQNDIVQMGAIRTEGTCEIEAANSIAPEWNGCLRLEGLKQFNDAWSHIDFFCRYLRLSTSLLVAEQKCWIRKKKSCLETSFVLVLSSWWFPDWGEKQRQVGWTKEIKSSGVWLVIWSLVNLGQSMRMCSCISKAVSQGPRTPIISRLRTVCVHCMTNCWIKKRKLWSILGVV